MRRAVNSQMSRGRDPVPACNYYSDRRENILFDMLKKSTELFPESSTAFETLAATYEEFGREDPAIENYRKVVELDPDNTNARKRLKRLVRKD